MGVTVVVCLVFESRHLLQLWLHESAPPDMHFLIIGCAFSALAVSIGSPLGTYLTGIGKIRNLGIIMVIEGIIVVTGAALLIPGGVDHLAFITFLPGCLALVRCCLAIPLLYRRTFIFSSARHHLKKISVVVALAGITTAMGWLSELWIDGTGIKGVGLRLLILLLPLSFYVASKLFSGTRKKTVERSVSVNDNTTIL